MSRAAERGFIGATIRHHPDRVDEIKRLRQEYRGKSAEAHVRQIIEKSPPLTEAQLRRLAQIFLSPTDTGAESDDATP